MNRYRAEASRDFWNAVAAVPPDSVESIAESLLSTGAHPVFDTLTARLRRVDDRLLLTLGAAATLRPHLVISAGGDRRAFPVVFALVEAAPPAVREAFEVLALRPRHPQPETLALAAGEAEVHADQVTWTARQHEADPRIVDLMLYVPGWNPREHPDRGANADLATVCFALLDHAVGEYAAETQIAGIDFEARDAAPDEAEPFRSLPPYLDQITDA
ncbi:hypothetical protein [Nocardioides sp. Leaf285]|uniref:hypothetical protein n=1 Tax=Nocardioides sp. Leaf285 TaxID=1736322 RepID=UPI000703B625|nr:hypothetical protein [Nocardioides sp. Leaf285]KQP62981.1 hypothetical protein ASF47_18385 [Nocardioides sp. Leaf285]